MLRDIIEVYARVTWKLAKFLGCLADCNDHRVIDRLVENDERNIS